MNEDHIREFAEIVSCQEIQALRGEWHVGDECWHPGKGHGIVTKAEDRKLWVKGRYQVIYEYLFLVDEVVWLPLVSSLTNPERSMVGAIANESVIDHFRNISGEWGVNVWIGEEMYCSGYCPTLEIAMAKALRWWLTEGKK